nr:unnamed protein product [Digitaria exilis]
MRRSPLLLALLCILLCSCLLHAKRPAIITTGTADGNQLWGYVQVREKAHLFWWYYKSPQRVSSPTNPWPTGPASSGRGNFMEIGPLDMNLEPRESTWLKKADLIFVVRQTVPSN